MFPNEIKMVETFPLSFHGKLFIPFWYHLLICAVDLSKSKWLDTSKSKKDLNKSVYNRKGKNMRILYNSNYFFIPASQKVAFGWR